MKGVAYLPRRGGRDGLTKLPRPPARTAGCNITAGGAYSCGGAGGAGVVSVYTMGATYLKSAVSTVKLRFPTIGRMCFFYLFT